MPFRIGPTELIIVLVIVMIIFGVGKLPEIGGAMGKALREFKKTQSDDGSDKKSESDGEILVQLRRLELQIADLRGALTEANATGSQASTGSRAEAEPGAS